MEEEQARSETSQERQHHVPRQVSELIKSRGHLPALWYVGLLEGPAARDPQIPVPRRVKRRPNMSP